MATRSNRRVPIVGIGASAGGLRALQTLLPAVTPPCGIAFVVVQHQAPDYGSVLPDILARVSGLPVVEINDGMPVSPDTVYVVPPNATLTLEDDRLRLATPDEERGQRTPIDGFLVSLAEACGERCACVILSGTGSDGTVGLRAIKENGGLAIAQSGAEFDGMMRSALATGLVDYTLPADVIPKKLCDYFRHLDDVDGVVPPLDEIPEAVDRLGKVSALIHARTGHDFSGYKDKTIARRVQRRMQVLQINSIDEYIARLQDNPDEIDALLQDLLIGVTGFFRDPTAFAALEAEVIPRLFDGKGPNDTVRAWVPGCSTGEEAYSIAMLLREHALGVSGAPKLQVFASDIDERSLRVARTGRYPVSVVKDLPSGRIERNFAREDGTLRIADELRDICLFSPHNVLRDAPFSKLDLISCRNLLIYLGADLQSRLIPLFHYALNDRGYLFLGSSENVSRHGRLFNTVDKGHRIFQKRPKAGRGLPDFPLSAANPLLRRPARPGAPEEAPVQALAEKQIMERYAPAYVVVSGEGELLHASGRTGKYLELAPGAPRTDLVGMARSGLRLDLRAALNKAVGTGQPVVQRDVVVGTNGGRQTINLIVQPLRPGRPVDAAYLVVFQDVGAVAPEDEAGEPVGDVEAANLRQLEADLRMTRERLQMTTEELEASNEELKSINEELSSMNEELQSSNEELETSKEELQSMNEELQTVNGELHARVEDLARANSDIANLFENTQIATIFLDRDLAVKSFTPAARDLFHLVESDAGRPIGHVRTRFLPDTLLEDAERVLRTLSSIERQVERDSRDARYIMRVLPYRTADNVIAGLVVTFVDVTRITAAEERIAELTSDLRSRIETLETVLDLMPIGILFIEAGAPGTVRVNRSGALLLGQSDEGGGLRPAAPGWHFMDGDEELAAVDIPRRAAEAGDAPLAIEGRLVLADGRQVAVVVSATPLVDKAGELRGAIAAVRDISARKRAEEHQLVLLHELQHRVKNVVATVGALAASMLKSAPDLESFGPAFLGRLQAMAAVHEVLSGENWAGADLRRLLETLLLPLCGEDITRLRLDGPDVLLTPNTSATLGLVFYELATNAAKYGALANDRGEIEVSWRLDAEAGRLDLEWIERGSPPVEPMKEGFGTSFVKRCVSYELRGSADLELEAEGLRCRLEFPFRRNVQDAPAIASDR